jgi:hypothetical protein
MKKINKKHLNNLSELRQIISLNSKSIKHKTIKLKKNIITNQNTF